MNSSETIIELAKALALLQAEMPFAPMNATNPFFNNAPYADLGSVIATSKPFLAKNGLSISQFPTTKFENGVPFVGVRTIVLHISGEWLEDTIYLPLIGEAEEFKTDDEKKSKKKTPNYPQKAGIIISYLRRYGWSAVLGTFSEKDTDGNFSSHSQSVRDEVGEMITSVVASGNKEKIASYRGVLKQYDPSGDANKISDTDLTKVLEELKKLG